MLLYPSHSVPAPRHNWSMLRPFNCTYTGIFNVTENPATQVRELHICPSDYVLSDFG